MTICTFLLSHLGLFSVFFPREPIKFNPLKSAGWAESDGNKKSHYKVVYTAQADSSWMDFLLLYSRGFSLFTDRINKCCGAGEDELAIWPKIASITFPVKNRRLWMKQKSKWRSEALVTDTWANCLLRLALYLFAFWRCKLIGFLLLLRTRTEEFKKLIMNLMKILVRRASEEESPWLNLHAFALRFAERWKAIELKRTPWHKASLTVVSLVV